MEIELDKVELDYVDLFNIVSEFKDRDMSIPHFCNFIFGIYRRERLNPEDAKVFDFMIPESLRHESPQSLMRWWKDKNRVCDSLNTTDKERS